MASTPPRLPPGLTLLNLGSLEKTRAKQSTAITPRAAFATTPSPNSHIAISPDSADFNPSISSPTITNSFSVSSNLNGFQKKEDAMGQLSIDNFRPNEVNPERECKTARDGVDATSRFGSAASRIGYSRSLPAFSTVSATFSTIFKHPSEKNKKKEEKKEKETESYYENRSLQGKQEQPVEKIFLDSGMAESQFHRQLGGLGVKSFACQAILDRKNCLVFLHLLCDSYEFFEFIFISITIRKAEIHPSWFALLVFGFKEEGIDLKIENQSENLYRHLKELFAKRKVIDNSSLQALSCLICNLSCCSQEEEELKKIYSLLLYSTVGRRLLCGLEEDNVEIWVELLNIQRISFFSEILLDSIDVLQDGEISQIKLKNRGFERIEEVLFYLESLLKSNLIKKLQYYVPLPRNLLFLFLEKVLALNSPILNMHICTNEVLIKIVLEKNLIQKLVGGIKRYFSFDFLFSSDEAQRAVNSNQTLLTKGLVELNALYQYVILNLEQVEKINYIQFAMKINECKKEWLVFYKEILALSVHYWIPSAQDLQQIFEIKECWDDMMIKRLANSYEEAYSPKHYTLDKLPQALKDAMKLQKEAVEKYEGQIAGMKVFYNAITQCRQDRENRSLQPHLVIDKYRSFIELIEDILVERKLKETEKHIQAYAEELTEFFLKKVMSLALPPEQRFFYLQNKFSYGRRELFYIRMDWYKVFFDLLKENKAIGIKHAIQKFGTPHLFLKEEGVNNATQELMRVVSVKKEDEGLGSAPSPTFT